LDGRTGADTNINVNAAISHDTIANISDTSEVPDDNWSPTLPLGMSTSRE
jgi:hypothetical protein